MAVLVVVASVGLVADGRALMAQSIWSKPLKFGVSFVIYGATLAWLLPKLRRARRTMWTLGTVFAVMGVDDVGFIAVQAARGTYRHWATLAIAAARRSEVAPADARSPTSGC
ncbi:hypothetical protein ACQPZA_23055 [Pseudonocardia xinjiangensis]|uniref:hypothetical protein n=1 Tax=Pseudonocardia xinjiangensis TaxID=75289 RepID=UPI003D935468